MLQQDGSQQEYVVAVTGLVACSLVLSHVTLPALLLHYVLLISRLSQSYVG